MRPTRVTSRVGLRLFGAILGLAAAGTGATQAPERQQELELPGLGVVLKVGWQLVLYHGCGFAAPENWLSTADRSTLLGSDGSSLAVASLDFPSWPAHKAQVRAAFGRVNVLHEDSGRRLWFEIGDRYRTQHYIDVSTGHGACIGILEIHEGTALTTDDIQRIIDGIGPVPEHWSPPSR
jgi:hypothetical protein